MLTYYQEIIEQMKGVYLQDEKPILVGYPGEKILPLCWLCYDTC